MFKWIIFLLKQDTVKPLLSTVVNLQKPTSGPAMRWWHVQECTLPLCSWDRPHHPPRQGKIAVKKTLISTWWGLKVAKGRNVCTHLNCNYPVNCNYDSMVWGEKAPVDTRSIFSLLYVHCCTYEFNKQLNKNSPPVSQRSVPRSPSLQMVTGLLIGPSLIWPPIKPSTYSTSLPLFCPFFTVLLNTASQPLSLPRTPLSPSPRLSAHLSLLCVIHPLPPSSMTITPFSFSN